ncbi:PilW family protein [Lysinibacillus sp. NPDC097214]|uniref:PilW family protein n=1 Tax=Lysinibacillus sp. NPDC097214 TaxID=3390584 RepID=UPI003D00198A
MKIHKESGLTLVEVLAVIVISSLIALIIYSALSQSSTNYHKQADTNKSINDAAYALKVITKEIRKNPNTVSSNYPTELTINRGIEGEIQFVLDKEKQSINRNGVIFSTDVLDFKISLNGQAITIIITNVQGKKFSAELYLRKAGIK